MQPSRSKQRPLHATQGGIQLDRQTALTPLQNFAKEDIVTMGGPSKKPGHDVCTWIAPQEWSALVDDPNTVVLDSRNSFVLAIDRFQSTMDP